VNDVLLAYGTGFGQTTPASRTGQPVRGISNTQPVTVTIDGVSAPVIYSIASPSFVGLYQVAFRVPAGIRAGTSLLKMSSNGVTSNTVMLPTISINPATP
jgi:uncharacterized protein (TIGR03437 family)